LVEAWSLWFAGLFPYNSPEHESDLVVCEKLSYTQPRKPISPARATMMRGLVLVKMKISAQAFPVIRDLMVNRSAFDRIIQAGGFISAPTGSAPAANAILVPKEAADTAFDAAACIGCGACVAACPNSAAMLFTSAKIRHLNSLPQGQPQRDQRTLSMVVAMMNEHFGSCTNHGECEAVCPKEIPLEFIGKMNRDLIQAIFGRRREPLNIPSVVQQPSHEDAVIEAAKS